MATEASPLLASLALVMLTAAAMTLLFHRFKQPAILGYLLAGFLVGPHTPLNIRFAEVESVQAMRDIGLVLLMFALGLEFNLRKLRRVGGVALIAGSLEIAFMLGLGFLVGQALGYSPLQSLFLGSVLAISSTTIIVAILVSQGRMDTDAAHLIFGILIVEDLAAIILIAVLGGVTAAGAFSFASLGYLVLALGIFVLAALVLGLVVVPRIIDYVSRLAIEEALVVTVLGLAFGMSLLAAQLGFSIALGAFIVGALISEARAVAHVERRIVPIRDMFTAVFFVAVGMLIEPGLVLAAWPTVVLLILVSVFGKIFAVGFASFVAGYPPKTALAAGIGLAMIGEFSFILASLAGDVFPELFPLAVAVSAGTTLITPTLMGKSPQLVDAAARVAPRALRTYATLYREWIARFGAGNRLRRDAIPRAEGLRLAAYSAVVVASVVGAGLLDEFAVALFPAFPALWVGAAVWGGFGLIALPALAAAVGALRKTIDAVAEVALPARLRDREDADAVLRVLKNTFWLLAAVAAASALLVFAGPFLPPLPILVVALGLILFATYFLYGSTTRLNRRLEDAVSQVVEDTPEPASRDEVLRIIREQYPWEVAVDHVTVPGDAVGAGRSLADLAVRRATGASIVAIERRGDRIVNPGPDSVIHAGDVLTILGEREQVAAARALLRTALGGPARGAIAVEMLPVLPESGLHGHTVAESGLREVTGATVVGIRRVAGETITNPPPTTRIQPGDILLVLGTRDQILRARDILQGERVE